MKFVSVVIPCFNAGRLLEEAVQSALAQTWGNLEIVIVDDGSTDADTLALLESTPWPRTKIFRQPNAGPAVARNRAIREARGEYILPLDADDTIDPTYVEKAVAVLNAHPEVGCVYCRAMKFGAEQGPWDLPPYRLEELVIDNVVFVTALFRKADWQEIGGFDERLRHGVEDYDFWVKMVASGRDVVQLNEFLFHYRVQEKSRTTRFQDGVDGKIATYAEIFRNNKDFYAAHAETLFKHRFELYAQIEELRVRSERTLSDVTVELEELRAKYGELEASSSKQIAYWRERYSGFDHFANRHAWFRKLADIITKTLHRTADRFI